MTLSQAFEQAPPLIFGIYPGGGVATDPGTGLVLGLPDDPARIEAALAQLQPSGRPFVVRGYLHYVGAGASKYVTPADMGQYVRSGRQLELAICYRPPEADLADWAAFVRKIVREYGPILSTLQIAEEPNNPDTATGGDGGFPHIHQALVTGIQAAKDEMQRQGYSLSGGIQRDASRSATISGCSWRKWAARRLASWWTTSGSTSFPMCFARCRSCPMARRFRLRHAVVGVLSNFRAVNLAAAHIPASVPIHIAENGWPTSPARPYERQAEVLEAIVRTIHAQRAALNITHYEYFDLRDADSGDAGLQFGLLRDDYTPKPAFERYRRLIAELG